MEKSSPAEGRIILIGGEKGGTGKTTTAVNLAVLSVLDGYKTMLADGDEQGSASRWSDYRSGIKDIPYVEVVAKRGQSLQQFLNQKRGDYDNIFVDAGGRDSAELRFAMNVADIFLIPIKPSEFDFWTLSKIQDLLIATEALRGRALDARILISQSPTSFTSRERRAMVEALEDSPQFSVCTTSIGYRKCYSVSGGEGKSVMEYSLKTEKDEVFLAKAQIEMKNLYAELFGRKPKISHKY